jgi:hypothetical protein
MRVKSQVVELGAMLVSLTSNNTYDVMHTMPYFDE